MDNSLVMKTDTSFTLNFLIYIQNIFLNQNEEELRFPYLSNRMMFKEQFELKYKELWNEVSEKIFKDNGSDSRIFYEEKDVFYQRLFMNNAESLTGFNEVYISFQVWWDSFAGRFSVERSINEIGRNLYLELANFLKNSGVEPQKHLNIILVYDDCLLANNEAYSYFAILPIKDFFVKYKELVSKLRECFY
ncbi:hypothetical protein [Virgibacillus senegalensis]|uniref:hypothetical protein n=1 Tax=Virgibacillus senegalensis TaxID=1499679 RepID=UPI00069E54F8|nr:hypothetical protein [Virgibacillus senegalensis]